MPTYIFKNTNDDEVFEKYMSMSELDSFKKQYPYLKQIPTIMNAVGGVGGVKLDNGFKDLLNNIKKNSYGSTMENY